MGWEITAERHNMDLITTNWISEEWKITEESAIYQNCYFKWTEKAACFKCQEINQILLILQLLLAKIMTLFSIKEKLIKGKNFYITINPEDIIQYISDAISHNNILNSRINSLEQELEDGTAKDDETYA